MKQKEVTLYEYIFSREAKKLYKIEHLCRETESSYIINDATGHLADIIDGTKFFVGRFNCTYESWILKTSINKFLRGVYGSEVVISLNPHAETEVMQIIDAFYRKRVDDACKMYQEACAKLNKFNRVWAEIKASVVKTPEDLYDKVMEEYWSYDVMLNSLHFDFLVRMPKRDILNIYAQLQNDINGDLVVRIENGTKKDPLVPDTPEFDEIYDGNCKDFLESLNEDVRFHRLCEGHTDCVIDFIG